MRYIELNPVSAGMVAHPSEYRWSSFLWNSSGAPAGLLTPHPVYLGLSATRDGRRKAYQALFGSAMPDEDIESIRGSTFKGTPLK